jgi:hypothetical protein
VRTQHTLVMTMSIGLASSGHAPSMHGHPAPATDDPGAKHPRPLALDRGAADRWPRADGVTVISAAPPNCRK